MVFNMSKCDKTWVRQFKPFCNPSNSLKPCFQQVIEKVIFGLFQVCAKISILCYDFYAQSPFQDLQENCYCEACDWDSNSKFNLDLEEGLKYNISNFQANAVRQFYKLDIWNQ